jgi:hypothetical protein
MMGLQQSLFRVLPNSFKTPTSLGAKSGRIWQIAIEIFASILHKNNS